MKNIILILAAIFTMSAFPSQAGHLTNDILIAARLNGGQEVPAVTTDAAGIATFMLNETRDTMCINISVNGLSGPMTGIHIHEGAAGTNGGVVFNFTDHIVGNRVVTTLTGNDLSAENVAKFLTGQFYLNVHTDANAGGEIRGQLILESDLHYTATLSGLQEVPAVTTDAYGLGVFNLAKNNSELEVNVVVQGLSGAITGAHLHSAAAGMNGGVVANLGDGIIGNVIRLTIDPSSFLADLKAGNIYINVHTDANAGGEIRGQLSLDNTLGFDATLTGGQEVPAVTTEATGVASFKVSPTLDTLWYSVVVDGLSGAMTGAHLHEATAGNNGGVAINLSDDIDGNKIEGMMTGLTGEQFNDMIGGAFYLNIHTDANAGGEIRGQVYRLMREGYVYSIDATQAVPTTTSTATGSGMVSIDRGQSNAHIMMVMSGLSGAATAAHFHEGAAGVAGGVVFDLSPFLDLAGTGDQAFLYWSDGFTSTESVKFRSNTIYVNVHTDANPSGEVRGQVLRNAECFTLSTGIENYLVPSTDVRLFPNPVQTELNLQIDLNESVTAQVVIRDILGKSYRNTTIEMNAGSNQYSIPVKSLTNGVYFLNLYLPDGSTKSMKFIKMRD